MCIRRVCMAVAVLACVVSSAPVMSGVGFASDRNPGPAANVFRVSDGELVASIERAVAGARRRLEEDRCAAVLGDFADAGGRILTAVAAEHGKPAADLLSRIIFRDGRDSAVCRGTSVVAFTGAGSRVVFICAARFSRLARDASELVVIHELLHTLGLGERPPSSRQIDNAVARRCHT